MTPPGSRSALPAGVVVVIAGPDGAGKSSLAGALASGGDDGRILWLHHRPRMLPSRRGGLGDPVTDPYGDAPYPWPVSVMKVVYYWLDYLLGWVLRVRPALRRGGAAVIERGWWDLAADPRRYRMQRVEGVVRAFGALLPRPAHTFVLTADVELLQERTGDNLTAAELSAQMAAHRRVFAGRRAVTFLDASESVSQLHGRVCAALGQRPSHGSLAGIPPGAQPRWLLPRQPRKVAAGALRIQRPMTPRALAVWRVARAGALFGAARFLPPADPAAIPDLARLATWKPAGGGVAVARSTHRQRHHALVVDARGGSVCHAKLAADADGQAALDREADNLQRFGSQIYGAVRAPRLLHHEPGLLITQAVAWRPAADPWRLDPVAAHHLGRWFHQTANAHGRGSAHGDFAPWNLLPTGGGWVLVDWEMATDDAPPFFDVLHWLVMAHAHLGRPAPAAIRDGLEGRGWIGACLRAYAEGAGLPTAGLRGRLVGYLDETEERVDVGSAEGARETAARLALRAAITE